MLDIDSYTSSEMLVHTFNMIAVPVVILFCFFAQPNIERSKITSLIFAQFCLHSIVAVALNHTEYGYIPYYFGMITTVWLISLIGKSEANPVWSINVMGLLWVSIVFNFIGVIMWIMYLPATAYNMAMLPLNLATVIAIMLNGASIGRSDVMAISDRDGGLLHNLRLHFHTPQR